ncbi:MAG: YqgE/AlgH family protein [Thiopseudomonas sp.]|nr:YqgE/AlgH family protein [Thiopseudomonas sp.]MCK9464370.1 YqgE/AlgH family protein [Thiopseudomonas sp.]
MSDHSYLSDHFLIAMPSLADSFFGESLIYLFEHSAEGAMGIVINQTSGLNLAEVLEQLNPEQLAATHTQEIPIYTGGPVQMEHGFVLHSIGHSYQQTATIGAFSLTTSKDILSTIADGTGPKQYLIALGYSGWGAGQLEDELRDNVWLSCPAQSSIIFDIPADAKRAAAAATLGVQLSQLSHHAGNA